MNSEFRDLVVFSLGAGEVLIGLGVALLCGAFIAFIYRITYSGISYSTGYVTSLVMLTLITALVIMVIGNNLARAFGLVGAMSIIRFRTAVKETQDIVFIFFALAIGLACGAGMYTVAATGTVAIGAVVVGLSLFNRATPAKREYLVELIVENGENAESELRRVFDKYCSRQKLVNIKRVGETRLNEYSYYVVLKNLQQAVEFTLALQNIPIVTRLNVFFDEG